MGRNSCGVKQKLRKGLWSPEEDEKLYHYITRFGVGCWSSVPKLAGLQRCGKSCRLRWINYLRPDLKRGMFSQEEEDLIINLHEALGNRWAQIAAQLPGRTDNEIKNFWNSSLKKKLLKQGVDPNTHKLMKDTQSVIKDDLIDLQQLARQNFSSKQVYDPLFLSEFQASVDPDGIFQHSSFLSHYDEQRQNINVNPIPNIPIINGGFNSMPNLTNFDRQSLPHSSRMAKFEAKDDVSSFQQAMMQINNNNSNNNVVEAFSWDDESKLDSVFQFQFSGIQIQEIRNQYHHEKLQNQSSDHHGFVFEDHRI